MKIFLSCLLAIASTLLFAQPCSNIQTIGCGTSINFNVAAGAGNASFQNGLGTTCYWNSGSGGLEKVYKFTAPQTGLYQFSTVSATSNATYVEYFYKVAANNCSNTGWSCLGYTSGATPLSSIVLNANDSIYILANAESTAGVSQDFQLSCAIAPPCNSVQQIFCATNVNFVSAGGYGHPNYVNGLGTTCYWNSGRGGLEKIYKFKATQTGIYTFATTTSSTNNSYIEYFYAKNVSTCSNVSWTCLGYANTAKQLSSITLNAGDSILILANAEDVSTTSQNFQLSCAVPFACNNITNITCGIDMNFNVNAGYGDANYTNGVGTTCYWNSGRGGFEKIYKFKATQSGTYSFTTTTASNDNSYVEYFFTKTFNGCNASAWTCLGYTNTAKQLSSFNINAGDSIFILANAEDVNGTSQNFQLSCGVPFACNNITNITCGIDMNFNVNEGYGDANYANGVGTTCYWNSGRGGFEKIYKFKATQSGTYSFATTTASNDNSYVEYFFTKTFNGCNTSAWTCLGYTNSASQLSSLNLNAGDSVFILVNAEGVNGTSQNFQLSCAVPYACSNVTSITCGIDMSFNVNAGYGDANYVNGVGTTCYWNSGRGGFEKIYKFKATQSGTYSFATTTASNDNSYVEYFFTKTFNGCNTSAWTCLGYTNSASQLSSFNLNVGDSIFILVNAEGINGTSQNFQLSCAVPFACSNITNITCGNDINFNVGAGVGDANYANGVGTICYWNSGRGGFEKIYRFIVPYAGTYSFEVTSPTSNSSYVEYLMKKSNSCSPTGFTCIVYTNATTSASTLNLVYGDTVLILANAEGTTGVSQSFRINCAANPCTIQPKTETLLFNTCSTYTYKSIAYTKDTVFNEIIKTKLGCDSIVRRVVITINNFIPKVNISSRYVNPCSGSQAVEFNLSTPNQQTPIVAAPAKGELYLVGDATTLGWGNPVPVTQKFERLDKYNYVGVFNLFANKSYRLLPENGSWSNAYGKSQSAANTALGGDFITNGNDISSPAIAGRYKIEINFLTGKYVVSAFAATIPDSLYVVGNAVPGGWLNPAPASGKMVRANAHKYQIITTMSANGGYLFLPNNGSWASKYSMPANAPNTTDTGSIQLTTSGGKDLVAPATSGLYKIEVNFLTNKFKVVYDSLIYKEDTSYINFNYQWLRNNFWVGANANTYIDSVYNVGDSISCTISHNAVCASVSSFTTQAVKTIPPSQLTTYTAETICASKLPYKKNNVTYNNAGSYSTKYTSSFGCDSLAVFNLTVVPNPTLQITANTTCLTNNTNLKAISAYYNFNYINWVGSDYILNPVPSSPISTNGVTVAGGNVASTNPNSFNTPVNVFVDDSLNLYVVDQNNNRIQRWNNGANTGFTVAGGYGYASNDSSFKTPMSVFVDDSANVFVADYGNHRIMKFAPGVAKGIAVAGNNGVGANDNQLNGPSAVYVTKSGTVYIADAANHRVQKWVRGAKRGTTVAGGNGAGSSANQFNNPVGLWVVDTTLYVSDYGNNRVQKWIEGAKTGTTVAGGNGAGSNANQLFKPAGIFVTGTTLYIADAGNNRIQRWISGSVNGITYLGGNGSGSNANQLKYPQGLFIASNKSIYVADNLNNRVQAFYTPIDSNWKVTDTGVYFAYGYRGNCAAVSNDIHIGNPTTPYISITPATSNICSNTPITFAGNYGGVNNDVTSIYWYKNNVLKDSTKPNFKDSAFNNNDSVYAILKTKTGCSSNGTVQSNTSFINVNGYDISGNIISPKKSGINKVDLKVVTSAAAITQENKTYNLSCINANNKVSIRPTKNNDIAKANGVSSVDVLLTQRHILNTTKLNSAYKLIAADVDGNKAINSVDILRMKRLILGTDTTFKSTLTSENRLWAFVDSAYQFPDTTNPFPFKDSISFTNLTSNKINQTFIGVKLGDVNYDWNVAVAKGVKINNVELIVDNEKKASAIYHHFSTNNFKNIAALQYTLHFDNSKYEFVNLEGFKNLQGFEYNAAQANTTGNIAMLWTDKNAASQTLEDGSELFTLILKPKDFRSTNESELSLTSDVSDIEAWDNNYKKSNIVLNKSKNVKNQRETIEVFSVSPNPGNGKITVNLLSNENKKVTFVLTNIYGKVIYTQMFNANKGVNNYEIDLNKNSMLSKGIYFINVNELIGEKVKKVIVE